jgi:NTP pyrophosphatase (non-canonical NTP hydrolase)
MMNKKTKIKKLEFIYKKVRDSGTKNSTEQFIYTVEEIGEIAEVLRCLNKDVRKKNKDKNDLGSEIGDTMITLYLITKFEDLDFFDILEKAINKEYDRWSKINE